MELSWLWSWFRRSRQEPESLFELSPDPMLLVDTAGIIRRANGAAHQLLGYDPGSMTGKPVDILIPPAARNQHRHLIGLFFSSTGERRMNNRIWIYDAQGQRINGEIHLVLTHWQGNPMALATIRDTSALWQEERKLREQRKAYDELFEHSAVGICSVSLGGRFLRVNRHFCDLLGYRREDMLELCFQDITYADDLAGDEEQVNLLLQGQGHSYSLDKRYRCADGTLLWVNLTVTLIRDEQDFPHYFISVVKDITKEIAAREALEQALLKELKVSEQLEQLLRTDPLTGCLNRQALYEELERQLELYRRYNTPCSLLFIDLNDFKQINDRYGHIAGDEALKALAGHIRSHIRTTDILARYAGDEFVVVLPQTGVQDSLQAMHNLRTQVLQFQALETHFPVTMSVGLAFVGYPDVRDVQSWLMVADQAMYLDKSGRQRAGDDTGTPH